MCDDGIMNLLYKEIKMTFQELDKRALEWNEICSCNRSKEERITMQIKMCHEEMVSEALHTIAVIETIKSCGEEIQKHNLVKLLDDFADSRFVFTEFSTLTDYEETHFDSLIIIVCDYAERFFDTDTLQEAYKRVIDSNFTKFVPVSEMTQDQAIYEAGLISGRNDCNCVPEKVSGYWVFRDENGKIRKPSTFKPVYLEDLV